MLAAVLRRLVRGLPGRARAAGWTWHAADRLLHPLRRRAARRRVTRLGPVRTVLFVCHGNICRSPYAAHAFNSAALRMGRNSTSALSAGFLAPDRPSPPEARTVALRRGVTLEAHRSRRVGERPWAGIDLVAVMNGSQAWRLVREHGFPASRIIILGDLDTLPITSREIPDPGGQGEAVFEETFDRIDRCLGVLYATLW